MQNFYIYVPVEDISIYWSGFWTFVGITKGMLTFQSLKLYLRNNYENHENTYIYIWRQHPELMFRTTILMNCDSKYDLL